MTTYESFYVGGTYVDAEDARGFRGKRMLGQAYVQRLEPSEIVQPFPVVMIPGGSQTGACFETTPDGRPGWAPLFADIGFDTYVLEQPGRGRSGTLPGSPPVSPPNTTARAEQRWTATAAFGLWPQAKLHDQWPGSGRVGDPVFDLFYASQVPQVADRAAREDAVRAACLDLLDRIGPSILLTHSQSGHYGWLVADAAPERVRGIVAVEPGGPPFADVQHVAAPPFFAEGDVTRPFGLTYSAIAYDPPVADPDVDLVTVVEDSDSTWLARCRLQRSPARRLTNLAEVPVVVVTGEASYHAAFDHCTVAYLQEAGVDAEHVRLGDVGIHGNGHFMMLEKNSADIARLIQQRLVGRGLAVA